ncbi:hypothetical protein LPJ53_000850 [Coemansia erecta]|uniref:Spp2/MOS2 G-patch domain-containing protein n=1 Tax=Coemansia erecta TaxID=147472 RepID=A0A9W7Y6N7_9FUNG|nr:hypothetical protein LPJ53_000850 [Coemansia erecta]
MRKSGSKVVRKPIQPRLSAFDSKEKEEKSIVGVKMALEGEQGDKIQSKEEEAAGQQLVIPVKRNVDWMKPAKRSKEDDGLRDEAIEALKKRDGGSVVDSIVTADGEEDSLSDDVDEETYERVPVEAFGAAMLRGMGWKGEGEDTEKDKDKSGKSRSKNHVDFTPRPSLLGLGAKPKPGGPSSIDKAKSKRY